MFELGSTRHAVDLSAVAKVIPLSPITPVPAAPAAMLGAMNVGGKVVPVLDIGILLGRAAVASPVQGDESLLLRASGYEAVGVVGRILNVRAIPEPEGDDDEVAVDGEPVRLVDIGALLCRVAAEVAQMAARAQVSVFSGQRPQQSIPSEDVES